MILAGDVGGTKILLEAGDFRSERWEPVLARRYLIAEHENLEAVIEGFLQELAEVVGKPDKRLRHQNRNYVSDTKFAVGAAGMVEGNRVKMTHRAWTIDGDKLKRRFGFASARVVNDLAAAAHGIDVLPPKDLKTLQPGRAIAGEPRVVLGVGTGLGIAYLIATDHGYQVIPGEGGHVGFSPGTEEQRHLWERLHAIHGRVEAEHICSGTGIANIYEALGADPRIGGADRRDAAWIHHSATENKDPQCAKALDLFAECLGNVAGDHALATLARGGVFIAGGVVAKIAPSFNFERFRAAFCAKGLFSSQLMRIPVKLVTSERLALIGAARIASME